MANSISIGASSNIDLIRVGLVNELKHFEGRGLKLNIEENPAGKYTFLSCSMSGYELRVCNEEDILVLFKNYIADVLSDLIVYKWQKAMLVDIIRENYYYFSEDERFTILQNALRYLEYFDTCETNSLNMIRKKRKVTSKLKEFLNSYNQIVVEGFIRFRMKEYIKELQEAVEKAVDDFLMEREYNEFIQLLKYFVDVQDSRMESINVVMNQNGVFKLYDEQNKTINSTYLEGYIIDFVEEEINYEDLLISALITLAPSKIIFHNCLAECPPNTLETIKKIFSQRVAQCWGCELCSPEIKN